LHVQMLERLAGAPISWGVCEVPGWGLELLRITDLLRPCMPTSGTPPIGQARNWTFK